MRAAATASGADGLQPGGLTPAAMEKRIHELLPEHADLAFAAGQRRFFRHEVKTCGPRADAVREISRQACAVVKRWPPGRRGVLGWNPSRFALRSG